MQSLPPPKRHGSVRAARSANAAARTAHARRLGDVLGGRRAGRHDAASDVAPRRRVAHARDRRADRARRVDRGRARRPRRPGARRPVPAGDRADVGGRAVRPIRRRDRADRRPLARPQRRARGDHGLRDGGVARGSGRLERRACRAGPRAWSTTCSPVPTTRRHCSYRRTRPSPRRRPAARSSTTRRPAGPRTSSCSAAIPRRVGGGCAPTR